MTRTTAVAFAVVTAAVFAVSGCGQDERATTTAGVAGPEIRAQYDPASDEIVAALRTQDDPQFDGSVIDLDLDGGRECSFSMDKRGRVSDVEGCTPEQVQRIRASYEREWKARKEVVLVEGTTPRVVARVPLSNGETAFFVVYRARNGHDCGFTISSAALDTDPVGDGAVGGLPCGQDDRCKAVCVVAQFFAKGDLTLPEMREEEQFDLVSGTVEAQASQLRVTTRAGKTFTIALNGPLLAPQLERRVFFAELEVPAKRYEAVDAEGNVVGTFEERSVGDLGIP